ncbi:MAG: hypothetical protein AAGG08_02155 [Actinomycetota bacterium]
MSTRNIVSLVTIVAIALLVGLVAPWWVTVIVIVLALAVSQLVESRLRAQAGGSRPSVGRRSGSS